ncbi:15650_t:CDS:2, partial [Acaulospora colombiana]
MDDLPRQTGFLFAVMYCVGIIHSIPTLEPSNDHFKKITPNKHLVDIGGISLMLGPFLVNTPISYMTGYFAENNNLEAAEKLFKLSSLLSYHMDELRQRKKDIGAQWKLETLEAATTNPSPIDIPRKPAVLEKQAFAMVLENINKPISEVPQSTSTSSKVHPLCSALVNSRPDITNSTSSRTPDLPKMHVDWNEPSSQETKCPDGRDLLENSETRVQIQQTNNEPTPPEDGDSEIGDDA